MKKLILILMVGSLFVSCSEEEESFSVPCDIYGNIYITDDIYEADYIYYMVSNPNFTDLNVWYVNHQDFANYSGAWHIVDEIDDADFKLYEHTNSVTQSDADFKIYDTSHPDFAGCP